MIKKNLKKLFYMNVILFYLGLLGLVIGLTEFNNKYKIKVETVNHMTNEVAKLEERVTENREKIEKFDFMEYKIELFKKKYPIYSQILDSVYQRSRQYGFSTDLVLGVMQVESNFNPTAVSNRGAYGLMQVNLSVWKDELSIKKDRIFDIDYNIGLGLEILKRYYIESEGNMQRALHLYNNGYKYNNLSYVKKVNAIVSPSRSNKVNVVQTLNSKLSS